MATPDGSDLQPELIDKLRFGGYSALAMLAGMQLDVFTPLKDGPMTAEQIAAAIGVGVPRLRPLLYALVVAELLAVEGGLFSNTPEAHRFLVRRRPDYIGDGRNGHRPLANFLEAILKTADSIRADSPQAKIDYAAMSQEDLESVARGMHPYTKVRARDLLERHDFTSYRTLLDLGGGSGALSIALTDLCPNIKATVVDLPTMIPITQRLVDEDGATDRVQVVSSDVVRDPLEGPFDVAVLSDFIQVLSRDHARQALRNVSHALRPGGTIIILGLVLDDSRLSPAEWVLRNLRFINVFDDGQAYTEQEYRGWLSEAGFDGVERLPLPDTMSMVVARKPA